MSYHVVEKLFSEYDIRNVVVCFNISISISISICCDFFLVHVFRFVSELSGVVSSLFPEAYHAVIFAILVLWKYRHP